MTKMAKLKNTIVGLLKVLFSLGLLYWLYQKGVLDFGVLKNLLNPSLLISSLVFLAGNLYFITWRWQLFLKVQKLDLGMWECFKLNLIGLFFNYVMPGGVGGDVVKGFYIVKEHPGNRMGAAISVLLDRVMGLYAMLLLALGSLFLHRQEVMANPKLFLITQTLVGLFILFTLALALAFSEKFRSSGWQSFLQRFKLGQKLVLAYESVYTYSHHLGTLGKSVILSLVSQVLAIILIWWLGINLGFSDIPLATYFAVAPLGFMVTAVPISPAGVGVGQMAFYFLFNLFMGQQTQVGPSVITAFQVLNFIFGLTGIWFFIQRKSSLREVEGAIGS